MLEAIALALLLRTDPVGDAVGAGNLVPPTATVLADVGAFDLTAVEVLDESTWAVRISFASRVDPVGTPYGLGVTVADVYVDAGDGGVDVALPGVGLVLPRGLGWEIAFRVHADEAHAIVAPASTEAPPTWEPVDVTVDGTSVTLRSSVPRTTAPTDVYAVAGVYDPFTPDGWRQVASSPSPWAFSSATPSLPVVDVLAVDAVDQSSSLTRGVFPRRQVGPGTVPWLALMIVGASVASVGVVLRVRAVPHGGLGAGPWDWRPWRDVTPEGQLPWIEEHEVAHLERDASGTESRADDDGRA